MNPQLFLAFIVVAAALACTPGVDWAYTIAAGLRQRSFVPAVAGLCGGYVLHTVLLVAGLAARAGGNARRPGLDHAWPARPTFSGSGLAPSGRGAAQALAPDAVGRLRERSCAPSCRAWAPAGSTPRGCCSTSP